LVVPWSAMTVTRDGNTLVLTLSPRMSQQVPDLAEHRHEDNAVSSVPYGEQKDGGWGAETPYGRLYDPAQEQTISGQVRSVETTVPMPGMDLGMQILVQTDAGKSVRVQVGPEWYLQRQNVEIKENIRVQVTGASAEVEGQPVLMAREVQL